MQEEKKSNSSNIHGTIISKTELGINRKKHAAELRYSLKSPIITNLNREFDKFIQSREDSFNEKRQIEIKMQKRLNLAIDHDLTRKPFLADEQMFSDNQF